MTKITGLSEDTTPTSDDVTVAVDTTSGSTKKVKWSSLASLIQGLVMPYVRPIGSVYFTTINENPNTTFGFGTWTVFAPGRAIVGVAPGGTFAGVETEVGEEAVTLDATMLPAHTHAGTTSTTGNHNHYSVDPGQGMTAIATSSTNRLTLAGSAQQISWGNSTTSTNGNHSHTFTTDGGGVGGQSHNNIQPSTTVYAWKRTA